LNDKNLFLSLLLAVQRQKVARAAGQVRPVNNLGWRIQNLAPKKITSNNFDLVPIAPSNPIPIFNPIHENKLEHVL
jgi:hypothetical protein